MKIGKYNQARVTDDLPQGFYLETEDGDRILLPGSSAPENTQAGDTLRVFIYMDSEDRPIATMKKPFAVADSFAVLKVKEVNQFGAFLDWGIDKDLMLPFKQQLGELKPGDLCVVYILEDKLSGRLIATEKIKSFFDRDTKLLKPGQKVELAAYEVTKEFADFLVDYRYTGRLYLTGNEDIYIGDILSGYIQNIRDDGKISVSLTPVGFRAVAENADIILDALERAGGFLPFNDDTPPEVIRKEFGISKKTFKKMIGTLFRQEKIRIAENGIRLL
ncbi:MAG: hypothetical protein LBR60_08570 [Fibrobacter sp.]|jgi:predicted RNA-binding protein (virulence factor B family)|nr:hypothetical protein [Fibrobacter sp.]